MSQQKEGSSSQIAGNGREYDERRRVWKRVRDRECARNSQQTKRFSHKCKLDATKVRIGMVAARRRGVGGQWGKLAQSRLTRRGKKETRRQLERGGGEAANGNAQKWKMARGLSCKLPYLALIPKGT